MPRSHCRRPASLCACHASCAAQFQTSRLQGKKLKLKQVPDKRGGVCFPARRWKSTCCADAHCWCCRAEMGKVEIGGTALGIVPGDAFEADRIFSLFPSAAAQQGETVQLMPGERMRRVVDTCAACCSRCCCGASSGKPFARNLAVVARAAAPRASRVTVTFGRSPPVPPPEPNGQWHRFLPSGFGSPGPSDAPAVGAHDKGKKKSKDKGKGKDSGKDKSAPVVLVPSGDKAKEKGKGKDKDTAGVESEAAGKGAAKDVRRGKHAPVSEAVAAPVVDAHADVDESEKKEKRKKKKREKSVGGDDDSAPASAPPAEDVAADVDEKPKKSKKRHLVADEPVGKKQKAKKM